MSRITFYDDVDDSLAIKKTGEEGHILNPDMISVSKQYPQANKYLFSSYWATQTKPLLRDMTPDELCQDKSRIRFITAAERQDVFYQGAIFSASPLDQVYGQTGKYLLAYEKITGSAFGREIGYSGITDEHIKTLQDDPSAFARRDALRNALMTEVIRYGTAEKEELRVKLSEKSRADYFNDDIILHNLDAVIENPSSQDVYPTLDTFIKNAVICAKGLSLESFDFSENIQSLIGDMLVGAYKKQVVVGTIKEIVEGVFSEALELLDEPVIQSNLRDLVRKSKDMMNSGVNSKTFLSGKGAMILHVLEEHRSKNPDQPETIIFRDDKAAVLEVLDVIKNQTQYNHFNIIGISVDPTRQFGDMASFISKWLIDNTKQSRVYKANEIEDISHILKKSLELNTDLFQDNAYKRDRSLRKCNIDGAQYQGFFNAYIAKHGHFVPPERRVAQVASPSLMQQFNLEFFGNVKPSLRDFFGVPKVDSTQKKKDWAFYVLGGFLTPVIKTVRILTEGLLFVPEKSKWISEGGLARQALGKLLSVPRALIRALVDPVASYRAAPNKLLKALSVFVSVAGFVASIALPLLSIAKVAQIVPVLPNVVTLLRSMPLYLSVLPAAVTALPVAFKAVMKGVDKAAKAIASWFSTKTEVVSVENRNAVRERNKEPKEHKPVVTAPLSPAPITKPNEVAVEAPPVATFASMPPLRKPDVRADKTSATVLARVGSFKSPTVTATSVAEKAISDGMSEAVKERKGSFSS